MADNIKIVGNILSTTTVPRYSSSDARLIQSKILQENFGETGDYIEFYIYDAGGNLLSTSYNYLNYKLPSNTGLTPGVETPPNTRGRIQTTDVGVVSTLAPSTSSLYPIIEIDPVGDLQNIGYSSGEFNIRYNLFHNRISNYVDRALFVKEISPDRTEIRLASTTLTNDEIETTVNSMIDEINNSSYYVDYLLNFGNNEQYVTVNIALNKATTGYEVLFKLYQPLPPSVQEKQTLWVVEEKVTPYIFDVNLDRLITPPPGPTLRGPNFSIPIENQGTVSTQYNTYGNLVSNLQALQQNSYHQILNLLATQSVDINIDYTDFNNFIFFGSAYQRLSNFHTKAQQIEDYNSLINTYSPLSSSRPSLITEINSYSSSISTLISQFDGYESYLYFESSSYAWPKSGSLKPYTLLSTGSAIVESWYNTLTGSAKDYDANNYNNLEYAIPVFVKDDANNAPFLTFLNMVGQYFDNIWIYLSSITDINLANNNLEQGISKDLVYERLKSLGVHLYNSQAGNDVSQYLIGANTGSSIFDNNFTITGSYLNNVPRKDLLSELYKRIYHNLPLLVKTKGTVAGLEHLITTFGITGSILNVKEFGGGTKAELLKGYNNDKVRIVANTITGSVLSPLLSLQTFPTASSNFRDDDTHYVDISFSPETQIDTYISGAIAVNNPSWSLDDYIGDPRQQYSGSYPDLDAQRKLYFQTGVPGFAPFTASLLDYNGFIRLIQYFDNALFKMLEDFTPERTSLSTGVTINSPVLERNKAAYSIPNVYTQSVYTAQYPTSSISSQYGYFYNTLSSSRNTMGWYDGEFSGSTVDVHQYFVDNYNPYLQPTKSLTSTDLNKFAHSDWNVLLNNISSSITSSVRDHIEYIFGTTGSITSSAELQDSYLTLRSYNLSRYEGSKTTSLLYNTYTSASYTGSDGINIQVGDDSYGKTAAIDRYARKIGLFTQIESSSFLPKRNTIALKYLVDEFGNLTELNKRNKHWEDVQRTFMMGDTGSIALFDNKKYSNQKTTDGEKIIFDSGYTYSPVLYGTGNDARLYFETTGESSTYRSSANFLSSSYFITGSPTLGYKLTGSATEGRYLHRIFNNITEGSTELTLPAPYTASVYTIPEGGSYKINASITVDMTVPGSTAGSASFQLTAFKNSSLISGGSDSSTPFNFVIPSSTYSTTAYGFYAAIPYTSLTNVGAYTNVRNITVGGVFYASGSTTFYKYTNIGFYQNGPDCSLTTLISGDMFSLSPTLALNRVTDCGGTYSHHISSGPLYSISDFFVPAGAQTQTRTYTISIPSTTFVANDKITVRFSQSYAQTSMTSVYTASISYGSLTITSLANNVGNYPYSPLSSYYFSSGDIDTNTPVTNANQLVLSPSLTSFYSNNYQFISYWVSGSLTYSSSLYNRYGEIDYPFQLGTYDIFSAYDISGSYFETRILDATKVTGSNGSSQYLMLTFANDVPANLTLQLTNLSTTSNKPAIFLFLKRVPDETNAYLTFKKRIGLTSYGFMIPENLAPDVLANIDTITKEVKQKLLADQQGTVS